MGEPLWRTIGALGRWILLAVNLTSGVLGSGVSLFGLYQAAQGTPIGARDTLAIYLYVAFLAFFVSGSVILWRAFSRLRAPEHSNRQLRIEGNTFNLPQGLPLDAWTFKAIEGAHETREKLVRVLQA